MFKSPSNAANKRGPISFIKTVASPRQPNSAKTILTENDPTLTHYQRHSGVTLLSVEIAFDKFVHNHRCVFTYHP